MAPISDTLDNIRVLVCLANEDRGTALAHGLREEGLDVLVAHRIKAAMRVMEKESPQAVVVEVATTAYDGFRVAQWASGRVMAIFLVAERELTLMEDVEVLKAGAKEVFYAPLKASTIAASIRGACGADTVRAVGKEAAEPKTRYSAPPSVAKRAPAPENRPTRGTLEAERQPLEEWDTGVMAPLNLDTDKMDTLTDTSAHIGVDEDRAPPSMRLELQRRLAASPIRAPATDPAPAPRPEATPPADEEEDGTSSSLVADLFDDPVPSAAEAPEPGPSARSERSSGRQFEAPPDDDMLVSGVLDELDELDDMAPGSIFGSSRRTGPASRAPTEDDPAAQPAKSGEEESGSEHSSPTAMAEGPSTAEVIAAMHGDSTGAKWIARGLAVAVVCAGAWLGWLVVERMAPDFLRASPEIAEVSAEEAAAAKALEKLHAWLGDAAIAHREGRHDEASESYHEALKLDPESHIAARGLAAIAMASRDWKATRKALNRLAAIVPNDRSLPLQQGLVLRALGKKGRSRAELRRFIDGSDIEDARIRPAAQVYLSLAVEE